MLNPNGLYQLTLLQFGLSSPPSPFHKIISTIIEGCPGTRNLLDPIIRAGVGFADHDKNLEVVLQKLAEFNATANG